MRERRAYIAFPTTSGNNPALLNNVKVIEGLNVRFSVKIFSQAGLPSEATIDVYNLNDKDLQYLTTTVDTQTQKQNLFQLYAGYEGDVKLIYSGQIMQAVPDSYPDVILSIRGISGAKWWGHNIQLQSSKLTVMGLIERAAQAMGYTINIDQRLRRNNVLLNTVVDEFSFSGSPMRLLEIAQEKMGGITTDKDTVFISVVNDQINVWSPATQETDSILLINAQSGMIGLPQPTPGGCKVKILLNNSIKTGDIVQVQSTRVTPVNGIYYVISITHEGELRGNNWYTTLECARIGKLKEPTDGQ